MLNRVKSRSTLWPASVVKGTVRPGVGAAVVHQAHVRSMRSGGTGVGPACPAMPHIGPLTSTHRG